MGEAISPLFKKLIESTTFGELVTPEVKVEEESFKEPLEINRNIVKTISGKEANISDCFMQIKRGKVEGWGTL